MHRLSLLLPEGIARREALTRATSSSSVSRWISAGELVVLHPGIVGLPDRVAEWPVRAQAAALWTGGPLSHLSAITAAGLVTPAPGPIHVTVPTRRYPRGAPTVIAHRSDRRQVTVRFGRLEALTPERSLVDAWAWAHLSGGNPRARLERPIVRQALIEGVRSRGVRLLGVRAESDRLGQHPGREALTELLELVDGGCQSELEIWGVTRVLPGPPDVPMWVQQHPVHLGDGRRVQLDAAYVEARAGVELDGAAFHGSRAARERDLRRDSALAAVGWIVLRFSYARLMADPEGCRREIVAAVLARLAH